MTDHKALEAAARAATVGRIQKDVNASDEFRSPRYPTRIKRLVGEDDLRAILSDLAALAAENERMAEIVALADELVNGGGLVNRGVDRGLVVVEKADKSDPHYRLCTALEARALTQGDRND